MWYCNNCGQSNAIFYNECSKCKKKKEDMQKHFCGSCR